MASTGSINPSVDALVVRGGSLRDVEKLVSRIERAIESGSGAVLSVWASDVLPGETREATLRRVSQDAGIPHPKLMVTTCGALLAHGFELVSDTSDGQSQYHFHVHFLEPVGHSQVRDFIEVFDQPESNPTGGR